MTANERYRELLRKALVGLELAAPELDARFQKPIANIIRGWEQEVKEALKMFDIDEKKK